MSNIIRAARFNNNHRLWLSRIWDKSKPLICFIGLNPSIGDHETDDPTIRRLISFSTLWGYGGFYIVNLFSLIATDPKTMKISLMPSHPANDTVIKDISSECKEVVFCWGANGSHLNRNLLISKWFPAAKCFGKTKDGHPKHPLYLKSNTTLTPFH